MDSYNFYRFLIIKNIATIIISGFIFSGITFAQTPDKVVGDWQGKLQIGGQNLTIIFHIIDVNGGLEATLDSPDQGAYAIKADKVYLEEDEISIEINSINGAYNGKLNKENNQITGTWKQGGVSLPLNVSNQQSKLTVPENIVFNELWQGKLKISGTELRIVLKIYNDADGNLSAYLDSPDQGVSNIKVTSISKNDGELLFEVASILGKYKGAYTAEAENFKGIWNQGGMDLPLDLEKIDKIEEVKRPQNPTKPYPYNEEEVTFTNEDAGIKLAGTFTFPKNDGTYPAVVLVSGSGAQNRDEEIFAHKPFLVISDYLTRNGIAVLRFDDRGTAKSQGDFKSSTTQDFMIDALAAVDYLTTRKEVDKSKIGMIGHSEGGLIAPLAAVNSDRLSFIVMLAGPGMPGRDILIMQSELIARAEGENEDRIKEDLRFNTELYDLILREKDSPDLRDKILQMMNKNIDALPDSEKTNPMFSKENIEKQIGILTNPWFRNFVAYDPRPTLENITIPVLAINGEKDLQVPPKKNLAEIKKALNKAGNNNYKIIELPKLNHLFQTSETGAVNEYGKLEETFSPKALEVIKNWILEVTN